MFSTPRLKKCYILKIYYRFVEDVPKLILEDWKTLCVFQLLVRELSNSVPAVAVTRIVHENILRAV